MPTWPPAMLRDAIVSSGPTVFREDIELEYWRGQLFTGLGVDLQAGTDVTISPYVGAGLEFIDGELEIERWLSCCHVFRERVGDLDEDRIELFFGGIDIFVTEQVRLGIEGRGNGAGWGVATSVSWRF